jgi:hypothetical protein
MITIGALDWLRMAASSAIPMLTPTLMSMRVTRRTRYEVLFSKGVLSASAYRDRMRSDWGSNAPDVESLYSLDRYGGNTNAAAVQPNGDAAVVCPSFDVARLVNAAGGTAYSFHFDYGPVCGDVASSMRTGPHWASHASELAWVWGYEPHCYRNGSEQRLTQVCSLARCLEAQQRSCREQSVRSRAS